MKKILMMSIAVILMLGASGCSKNEKNKSEPTATVAIAPTNAAVSPTTVPSATPSKILTTKVSAKIDYNILQEFEVFKQDKGYGALILISPDSTKEDIIDLLKKIGENKDPVAIEVFTSQKAFEEYLSLQTTDEFKKGYVASYMKNKTLKDKEFYGQNAITWTQEIGSFSSFLFTTTNLDN
jgi:hypothetical protein